jgi:hypothetical protein
VGDPQNPVSGGIRSARRPSRRRWCRRLGGSPSPSRSSALPRSRPHRRRAAYWRLRRPRLRPARRPLIRRGAPLGAIAHQTTSSTRSATCCATAQWAMTSAASGNPASEAIDSGGRRSAACGLRSD